MDEIASGLAHAIQMIVTADPALLEITFLSFKVTGLALVISTIAGDASRRGEEANNPNQRDPFALNLPKISSMDFFDGHLFVPTDLARDTGDLVALKKRRDVPG